MTEQVTKLRVFVASPSDVQRERELLDDVIDELNRGIADEKGLVLELVRWETHAWPDIGEDAQDVINRQIAPSDIFVGIMWNRFGTPTKRAESGTKEEFDRAYAYWKKYGRPKIMFYFNCAPFSPSSDDQSEQKRKVLAFKKELDDKGAFYREYNGADEFERAVREHLTQVIRRWELEFNTQWAEKNIRTAIADAGERYAPNFLNTPNLNVKLPMADLFEGLGRTDEFWSEFEGLYARIKKAYSNANREKLISILETITEEEINFLLCNSEVRNEQLFEKTNSGYIFLEDIITLKDLDIHNVDLPSDKFRDLQGLWLRVNWRKILEKLLQVIFKNLDLEFEKIALETIAQLSSQGTEATWVCVHTLKEAKKKYDKELRPKERTDKKNLESYSEYLLFKLIRELQTINEFVRSDRALLANKPAMLVVGDALVGKTHLFCDIAKERIQRKLPTILVLGQHLMSADNPWNQILKELGLSCTREEFVGALDTWGQAQNSRVLLIIDALNEGNGKVIWYEHLAGFLEFIKDYPTIGVALSVRRSDLSSTVRRDIIDRYLIEVNHPGFQGVEYLALSTYCKAFGLLMPSIPIIPAFLNPGFLYLLCKGLRNKGENQIPTGAMGFSRVFEIYVNSIHEKLWHPNKLNYPEDINLVRRAVTSIVELMAERGNTWVEYEEAQERVNALLPGRLHDKSLFQALIAEGLFVKDRFLYDSEEILGVRFPYQKFENHFVAKFLIDKYLDESDPLKSFSFGKPLGLLVKDEWTCWRNRGLIEAFSIQLPERIQKELAEVAPWCADYQPVCEAFIQSLIWRDPKAITDATLNYINEHIIYDDTYDQFLNAWLTVASNPEHPYNADFLHMHLMGFELAERDAWWSIFLYDQYGEHGAVDRLVEWAWSVEDKSHIGDESIRLCGIALAWFLTTSNRFLRDRATKALVSLLANRIHVLRQIMGELVNVDDPYILERLFAVAYGCAMKSVEDDAIAELAKDVYKWIFRNGTPLPYILLRDYARGVIEVALHRGVELDIDVQKVRPPYKSEWPSEIPTEEELKKYGEWQEDMPDEEWAWVDMYDSVMGFGDFARYIIGTNSGHFEWSSRRLDEPRKPSRKEIYEDFVQSLTDRQKRAWERYDTIRANVDFYRRLDEYSRIEVFEREFTEEELEGAIISSEQSFRRTLGKKKLKIFEEHVIPYLNDPGFYRDEYHFDLSIAQCWILSKVLDLGWTVERFGRFDRALDLWNRGREANKPERIGKKYQWIAYHEFLARVSDNFEFRGEAWSDRPEKYEGPWQIGYFRDIDPSSLLKGTERERWQPHTRTWWFPSPYDAWDAETDDVTWLKSPEDLPNVDPLIEVTNPGDGSKWLVLEASYRWEQPTSPREERYEIPRREIGYMLKSYIAKKSDMEELFDWAKEQNFKGSWMPESHGLYDVFLGEFSWAPAFEYHSVPYYHYDGWTRGDENRIPQEVLVSTDQYIRGDRGYDCSIDKAINIYLPAKWLADHMGLRWNGVEGYFFDDSGDLIAFDPSVRTPGPGALLINRDALLKFLNENGYDILWTVVGEKNIIGGRRDDWKGRLELSGAYRIHENRIDGAINTRFLSRD